MTENITELDFWSKLVSSEFLALHDVINRKEGQIDACNKYGVILDDLKSIISKYKMLLKLEQIDPAEFKKRYQSAVRGHCLFISLTENIPIQKIGSMNLYIMLDGLYVRAVDIASGLSADCCKYNNIHMNTNGAVDRLSELVDQSKRKSSTYGFKPRKEPEEVPFVIPDEPHSIEAEKFVIGSLINNHTILDAINERCVESDFYDKRNQSLLSVVKFMVSNKKPTDFTNIMGYLHLLEEVENAGGEEYVYDICKMKRSRNNALAFADIVKEKAVMRKILEIAEEHNNKITNK